MNILIAMDDRTDEEDFNQSKVIVVNVLKSHGLWRKIRHEERVNDDINIGRGLY